MTSDKVWFATGFVVFFLVLTLGVSTLVGAVLLWTLSVFDIVQFTWIRAFALGIAFTVYKLTYGK